MRSNCWALRIASSSDWGLSAATSLAMSGRRDLRNQSRKIRSSSLILQRLRRRRHSWMWSVIWVAVFCLHERRISTPASYRTGNWKNWRKVEARDVKVVWVPWGCSIYHLAAEPVKVRCNKRRRMESSTMELEEHHRWKDMIWFWGSSPALPSNFGISKEFWSAWEANEVDG